MIRVTGLLVPADSKAFSPKDIEKFRVKLIDGVPVSFRYEFWDVMGYTTHAYIDREGLHVQFVLNSKSFQIYRWENNILPGGYVGLSYFFIPTTPPGTYPFQHVNVSVVKDPPHPDMCISHYEIINYHLNVAVLFEVKNMSLIRFLQKDGDHAAMTRVLKFLL